MLERSRIGGAAGCLDLTRGERSGAIQPGVFWCGGRWIQVTPSGVVSIDHALLEEESSAASRAVVRCLPCAALRAPGRSMVERMGWQPTGWWAGSRVSVSRCGPNSSVGGVMAGCNSSMHRAPRGVRARSIRSSISAAWRSRPVRRCPVIVSGRSWRATGSTRGERARDDTGCMGPGVEHAAMRRRISEPSRRSPDRSRCPRV